MLTKGVDPGTNGIEDVFKNGKDLAGGSSSSSGATRKATHPSAAGSSASRSRVGERDQAVESVGLGLDVPDRPGLLVPVGGGQVLVPQAGRLRDECGRNLVRVSVRACGTHAVRMRLTGTQPLAPPRLPSWQRAQLTDSRPAGVT